MKTIIRVGAIVSLAVRAFCAAEPVKGNLDSALLVSASGRIFAMDGGGNVFWEKKGCGNLHRAWISGRHVYWSNGALMRTEVASGKTETFYKPSEKEGVWGFEALKNGNVVVAENSTDYITELAAGTTNAVARFKGDPRRADGTMPNAHHHYRMIRKTPQGTYLVCCSGAGAVREYDAKGKLVWEQAAPPLAFDAIRRANGNTLISHLKAVTEYTPDHKVAWEFKCGDLPELKLGNLCGIQELENGNLVIGTYANGKKDRTQATAVEITREKAAVWAYYGDTTMMTVFKIGRGEWPAK